MSRSPSAARCQQHFLDLCELLGQPKPAEADPDGTWYTFEKGVQTSEDKKGWADVWMRDHFAWEYKGKHKDLKAAYQQLQLYREALENPPLMVVCDMDRFEVHTNFTGTLKKQHDFDLAGLADPANLDILRRVFTDPNSLKPGITSESITVEAAKQFAKLADGMRDKGIEPLRAAHFLMKLMFCMFGEDTLLLPAGLFGKLLDTGKANPALLPRLLQGLFEAMSKGGIYGTDIIHWFNGGLFADAEVLPLTMDEINTLIVINKYDWSSVAPSIFGTVFERTLDPAKRSQIGAHFTGESDIEDSFAAGPTGPVAARMGASQATLRRGSLAQGGQGESIEGGQSDERDGQGRVHNARHSIGPFSISSSGLRTSRFSILPAGPGTSFTWRSACCWTWRRKSSPTRPHTDCRWFPR